MEELSLKKQLSLLPKPLQDFILSEEARGKTKYLTETFGLTKEQSDLFEEEIFAILIGSSKKEELSSHLIEDGMEEETAQKLAHEATTSIFSKVEPYLSGLFSQDDFEGDHSTIPANTIEDGRIGTSNSDELEKTLSDLDTILKPDPADKPNWLHEEAGDRQKILHEIEVPPPPERKEKSIFEKKLDDNLYRQDIKKKPSDDPTIEDEMHKKISNDPYREQIP